MVICLQGMREAPRSFFLVIPHYCIMMRGGRMAEKPIDLEAVRRADAELAAISGGLLSAVISTRYSFGFRKHNSNVFNMLVKNLPITSDIKCVCY